MKISLEMANSKSRIKKPTYITLHSTTINSFYSSSLKSLLLSPKKLDPMFLFPLKFIYLMKSPRFWLFLIFLSGFIGISKILFRFDPLVTFTPSPSAFSQEKTLAFKGFVSSKLSLVANEEKLDRAVRTENDEKIKKIDDHDFWKQPDGLGYRPCLEFSREYKKWSREIVKERSKYLMVVVSGGMNQQRNEIVDAVVIARILGAALVVPVLQVNLIWNDESEFSDIFDLDHFKKVLADDLRIVSSLPSTHLMTTPVEVKGRSRHLTPQLIRSRYLRPLRRDGVLLLRALDSKLSKDLPYDLQRLRCKVAFHALRFVPPILEIGNKLTERMRSKGPYLALHLRMEKDVWVRTGCLPGLSHEYDKMITNERQQRPELLTSRLNMTYYERKLAGLCPLNALEVARLLKALRAPKNAGIYWAGGEPLGGKEALKPLTQEFPHFYNKEDLALPGELTRFAKKASILAAIDVLVSENSDVFVPSHGGNMGRAIQGHRAYAGHRKSITPDKRKMFPHFMNTSLSETEFNRIILKMHRDSWGQPVLRTAKFGRDVTKYPVPECMCNSKQKHAPTQVSSDMWKTSVS